jgi:hypothetical protein
MPRAPMLEMRRGKPRDFAHHPGIAGARTTWQDCYVHAISMRKSSELEANHDRSTDERERISNDA